MPFRFRKSIKLGGGLRVNLSKKGVGISGGVKGLRIGTGPSGTRVTANLPGTGVTFQKNIGTHHAANQESSQEAPVDQEQSSNDIPPQETVLTSPRRSLFSNPRARKITLIICGVILFLCLACFAAFLIDTSTPTYKATATARAVQTIAAQSTPAP